MEDKTLSDFAWILLASGTGAALASMGLEIWRHHRSRTESVRHLAMRLTFGLEEYAQLCRQTS